MGVADMITERYGTAVLGDFIVQQDQWNDSSLTQQQVIETTTSGFRVVTAPGSVPFNGAPASYPSMYLGVHYDKRSPKTLFPAHIDTDYIRDLKLYCTWTQPTEHSVFDVALDLWYSDTPQLTGQNPLEIMCWMHKSPEVQPVGDKVGSSVIDGITYDVWLGWIGWRVVSYVADHDIMETTITPSKFYENAKDRVFINAIYATSYQFGAELWQSGVGLTVSASLQGADGAEMPTDPGPDYGTSPEGIQK